MKVYGLLIVLSCVHKFNDAKIVEGTLNTAQNWQFITRFCFMSESGTLQYEFEYPESYMTQNLLLYWDHPDLWVSVYKSSLTCQQREAKLDPAKHQIIFMDPVDSRSGCQYIGDGLHKNGTIRCSAIHRFQTSRDRWWFLCLANCLGLRTCKERQAKLNLESSQIFPLMPGYSDCKQYNQTIYCYSPRVQFRTSRERWWYLVISNCDTTKGLNMKYKIWMRNGQPGDTFFEHFSADEFYILQTDITFLLLEFCVFIVCIVFIVKLFNKNMFHSTYRMFFISVFARCMYLLFSCIRWGVYANTGKHDGGLQIFADILAVTSLLMFILMLMLMSLGYTIVCGRLPKWIVITLFVFMLGIGVTYIVLFIYESLVFDPGWVLYRYESQPGYGIMGLLIVCWLVFIISGLFTAVTHPKKRKFYIPYLIFYTIWFWAVPTLVFISIWHMALWMRQKIVNGVECTIIFLGHLFYLWLTRPVYSNHNFPYHIKTQQIDTITLEQATDKALDEDSMQRQTFNPDIFTVQGGGSGDSPSMSFPAPKVTNPFLVEDSRNTGGASSRRETTKLADMTGTQERNGFIATGEVETPALSGGAPGESSQNQATPGDDFYVPRNIDSLFSFPNLPRS